MKLTKCTFRTALESLVVAGNFAVDVSVSGSWLERAQAGRQAEECGWSSDDVE
jgi:hypothetical protein